jgi:hypothetical protein
MNRAYVCLRNVMEATEDGVIPEHCSPEEALAMAQDLRRVAEALLGGMCLRHSPRLEGKGWEGAGQPCTRRAGHGGPHRNYQWEWEEGSRKIWVRDPRAERRKRRKAKAKGSGA